MLCTTAFNTSNAIRTQTDAGYPVGILIRAATCPIHVADVNATKLVSFVANRVGVVGVTWALGGLLYSERARTTSKL